MPEDMDSKGIYFDLQWKTKSGCSNVEEFGSIGIWEVDDSSLHWHTFKPYLCQTLGNLEILSISYIDSEGDEVPIDSDLEFQEVLKYARSKAANDQKIILIVEKLDDQSGATGGVELLNKSTCLKPSKFFKGRLKVNYSDEDQDVRHVSFAELPVKMGSPSSKIKTKPKSKDILCPLQSCDTPPLWFKKYMKKMKSEIVSEVTANVNNQMKKLLEEMNWKPQPMVFPPVTMNSNGSHLLNSKSNGWLVTKTKKKTSESESSDGAPKMEIRDSKILRKIEKLDRRERKLDHKKEKLEQKTRKIAERKEMEYLSKLRLELAGCKPSNVVSRSYHKVVDPGVASFPVPMFAQSCTTSENLESGPIGVDVKSEDMRMMTVKCGSTFTKVWKVKNSGGKQWTDETEVKLSWGNSGLNPEVSSVKCPPLAPGEEGEIAINFTSPKFPGVFESHWHFYHQNLRFGGRMSCIVSVDLIKGEEEPKYGSRNTNLSPSSSAEFIVVHPTSVGNDGSYGITGDGDLQVDCTVIPKATVQGSTNNDEPQDKANPTMVAFHAWLKEQKTLSEEKYPCAEGKEAELDNISTEGLSGSDNGLGSDSDENFVVVPMPPCFRVDIPLQSEGPSAVETNVEGTVGHVGEAENLLVNKVPVSHLPSDPFNPCHISEGSVESSIYPPLNEIPLQGEVSHDTGEVISVPAIPPQPKTIVSTPTFQQGIAQMSPKYQPSEPQVIIINKPNQSTPSSPFNSQHSSPTTSAGPSTASDNSTSSSSSAKSDSSRSPKERGAEASTNIPQAKTSPRSTPSKSRPFDLKPRKVTEVINEALNVTSSAITSAFAALDSILENPVGSSVTPGTVYHLPNRSPPGSRRESHEDPPPPPIDSEMASELEKLANMGFINIELNQALLRVYNHDLSQVIEALLNGKP